MSTAKSTLIPLSVHPRPRIDFPAHFSIESWEDIAPFAHRLDHYEISDKEGLLHFLSLRSEFTCVIEEDSRWRYIRQSCYNHDEKYNKDFELYVNEIEPKLLHHANLWDKKILESPYWKDMDRDRFHVYYRNLKNDFELFREENLPLLTQIQLKSRDYAEIIGSMTIQAEGKEITMAQASTYLQQQDRTLRKEVFEKIATRRLQDKDRINDLFTEMFSLRKQIALNAGFDNFRDYMMRANNRFDYGTSDCENFHLSVLQEVVPIATKIYQDRKEKLSLSHLHPYDLEVDTLGRAPLKPYSEVNELIDKTIETLEKSDPFFAQCVMTMQHMRRLDLDSRKGKSPGGYNMTLPETGVPFVFMNGAGTQSDVHTMVHEAGHAVHSILMHELPYNFDTELPSETAELASMGMELLSMAHWDKYYTPEDHSRAIRQQLESIILILPWIAVIDKFQHWIYTTENWDIEKSLSYWHELHQAYFPAIQWDGYDTYRQHLWHRQLHIFEVPFYYIEYGIAQLGAIGLWKNYHMQPDKAIEDYKQALALGNTVTIPEMYKTAGVNFDFSAAHIKELMDFVLLHL